MTACIVALHRLGAVKVPEAYMTGERMTNKLVAVLG